MNRRSVAFGVALILLVFVGVAVGQAQAPLTKVGFGFFAGGKALDSGKYTVELTPAGKVVIKSAKGKDAVELAAIKSLGKDEKVKSPKLVFDVVGSQRFLAQVWLPGQDGVQVGSVSGEHEQAVVGGSELK
jgi:hypothetical protein